MARISIVHSTEYSYRNPVGLMRHRLMLRPDDSHDLRLDHAALDVDPKPSLVHWTHDAFDNSICFVEWPEQLRTKRLSVVSTLDLTCGSRSWSRRSGRASPVSGRRQGFGVRGA